jgi:hypothetical protein
MTTIATMPLNASATTIASSTSRSHRSPISSEAVPRNPTTTVIVLEADDNILPVVSFCGWDYDAHDWFAIVCAHIRDCRYACDHSQNHGPIVD